MFIADKAWDAGDADRGIARVNRATRARVIFFLGSFFATPSNFFFTIILIRETGIRILMATIEYSPPVGSLHDSDSKVFNVKSLTKLIF